MAELITSKKLDKKSESSGFVLERTAKRLKQFFQQQLTAADTGITIDQWVVLQVLDRRDGLSQLDIARETYKDAPTITRIIDLLCRKGLTRRITDPADRRRFKIQLTGEGREKIDATLPIIRDARRQAWQGIEDAEIDRLVDVLNSVFENLSSEETK
ncbi:MAG: MarR family transcriptional regulator [Phaeodactylibacter sp.]|nr:MarR family transcriptional regulator [Phaeodactylibacter sp.]